MSVPRPVLVAVDFSACSRSALVQGIRIARWTGAPVEAVHVVGIPLIDPMLPPLVPITLPSVEVLVADARRQWEDWTRDLDGCPGTRLTIRIGSARAQILELARTLAPQVIVLGVFGRGGSAGGLGSVAGGCVRRAEGDVLLVRQDAPPTFPSVAACIDFSEGSRSALDAAVRYAARDDAALHILHVYDDPWHGLTPPDVIRASMPEFRADLNRAVEARLRDFCAPAAHELGGLRAQFHAVQSDPHLGSYGRAIARFLSGQRIHLGILATHSARPLRDAVLGSTAERVLRDAPCSLLAVKPRD